MHSANKGRQTLTGLGFQICMLMGDSMISGGKSYGETTRVLEKTSVLEKTCDVEISPRLLELREKIQNQEYVNNAIARIAQVISNHLIENPSELKFRDV